MPSAEGGPVRTGVTGCTGTDGSHWVLLAQQGPAQTSVSRLWAPSWSRMMPTRTAPEVSGRRHQMQARPAD
ncbi:hypothetical protein EAO72_26355 [Streptomyces sp. or43]|nr:hypothetical protein EAO72_26355 [Streptomyces sp. or43]